VKYQNNHQGNFVWQIDVRFFMLYRSCRYQQQQKRKKQPKGSSN